MSFNLSEKIHNPNKTDMFSDYENISVDDVKEFIKLLKWELRDNPDNKLFVKINKLAGDKLI